MARSWIRVVAGLLPGLLVPGLLIALLPARAEADVEAARVLVWPVDAETPAAEAEAALAADGYRVVPFAPIADRLRAHGARAQAREAEVLGTVEQGLRAARQAYLDQRFDDMIATLAAVEQDGLEVLARPPHIPVLWEVMFQRGLAHLARGQEGDAERARDRFLLALALEPTRRPLRELYGPDVAAAFADALSTHAARLPRPVPVRVTPDDAQVIVDGAAVPEASGARRAASLRPGLHVVRAVAPGYEAVAVLAGVDEPGEIVMALGARAEPDPVDRIGASWSAGMLRAHAGAGLRAVQAVAAAMDAPLVVVLEAPVSRGVARAWLVSGGRVHAPVQRPAAATAVRAALAARRAAARLDSSLNRGTDSRRAAAPGRDRPAAAAPPWTRWWFWAGVGAVTAGAVLAGSALDHGPARWQIYAPPR